VGFVVAICGGLVSFANWTSFLTSFLASITVIAAFLASACVLSSTYLTKISSSGSISSSVFSSRGVYRVFILAGVAEASFGWGAVPAAGMLLSSSAYRRRTHLDVPLMSSIFFTLFLVCSI
jgi:hypothetical protein